MHTVKCLLEVYEADLWGWGMVLSRHCSMIFLSAKMIDLINTSYSFPEFGLLLRQCVNGYLNSIQEYSTKTWLGRESKLILQQSWRLPFSGSLTIRPLDQSLGIVSMTQIVLKRSVRTFTAVSMLAFSNSTWIESMPVALPHFMSFMSVLTSASLGGLVSMLRALSAVGWSSGSGSGQFRTSWKCWTHLAACSCSVVIVLSFLSCWLVGVTTDMLGDPVYSSHIPLAAAS